MSTKNFNIDYLLSLDNPHPIYNRMRKESPIHFDHKSDSWLLTRYKDIKAILSAPSTDISRAQHIRDWFLMSNMLPNEYRNVMSILKKMFSARETSVYVPYVESKMNTLLDFAQKKGGMEFIVDFVRPLFFSTISKVLGMPYDDLTALERQNLLKWFADIDQYSLAPLMLYTKTPNFAGEKIALQAHAELKNFFMGYVLRARQCDTKSLINSLCSIFDDNDIVCKWLVMIYFLFCFSETAVFFIFFPQMMHAIITYDDQFQQVRAEPSLMLSAIEEVLRYNTSRFTLQRQVYQDYELNGYPLRQGDKIILLRDAGNRDPEIFDHPEHFDIKRATNRHIAFLSGAHVCLGATFTKLMAPIIFNNILKRFSKINLVDARMNGPRQWGVMTIACSR